MASEMEIVAQSFANWRAHYSATSDERRLFDAVADALTSPRATPEMLDRATEAIYGAEGFQGRSTTLSRADARITAQLALSAALEQS